MKRYIALLRGINVSGKNRIPMREIKAGFEELGFAEVRTYLNSGNVAFSGAEDDKATITGRLKQMISDRFCCTIPVFVISREELADILRHAPDWWGSEDKAVYDNLIFCIPPATVGEILAAIGVPKEGLEQMLTYKEAIFWSFIRKDYQKTNWWSKTAAADIGPKLTIRTAATVRKICGI